MENRILKRNSNLEKDETKGHIIPFPNVLVNEEDEDSEDDYEKITLQVPKGYFVKIQMEKKDQSSIPDLTTLLNQNSINSSRKLINPVNDEIATDFDYGIMGLERINRSTNIMVKKETIMDKEAVCMKKSIMYDVLKEQLKFLVTAVAFIILSLIGMMIFVSTGKYFIHPFLYIFTFIMGIGWATTALISMKSNKV